MNKATLILIAVLFASLAFPLHSFAAEIPSCDFQEDAKTLSAIATSLQNEQEKIRAELAIRKAMLARVVVCARGEVKIVSDDLHALRVQNDVSFETFRAQLLRNLELIDTQYASYERRIKDLGIWGSKEMARAIREDRAKSFARAKEAVTTFILWHNQRDLIAAADARLAYVTETVRAFSIENEEAVVAHFEIISATLLRAKQEHRFLEKAFREQYAPEEGLLNVKIALGAMEEAYQEFSALSETVKTLVPRY